jgi:two-component system phosphate regulon sensor histidine kinase PhoR
MRKKITIYYLILAIAAVSIMAFFMWRAAYFLYQGEVEEKLVFSAKLITQELSEKNQKQEIIDFNQAAAQYAQVLSGGELKRTRITFIDFTGQVLGESATDYRLMGNHLNRREVREAIEKGRGMEIRSSGTLEEKYLYVALASPETGVVTRVAVPMVQLGTLNRKIIGSSLLALCIGLMLTAVLAWRFSHILLKPINALILAMQRVAQGDYAARMHYAENDEFSQVSEGFNRMTTQLGSTVAALQEKNAQVELVLNNMVNGLIAVDSKQRIILLNGLACKMFGLESVVDALGAFFIERIRNHQINTMLQETTATGLPMIKEISGGFPEEKIYRVYSSPLQTSNSIDEGRGVVLSIHDITKIKKLEQMRTEFVSNVSHELKTPLTSIRGFIETLRNGAVKKPEVAENFLQIIDLEAERLSSLINEILQLSEIETMTQDKEINTYLLGPLVDEVLALFAEASAQKEISIAVDIPSELVITANRNRVKQMFINLIDNAIKYNVEQGWVRIKAWRTVKELVISLQDSGIGIAEAHLDRIFERFYRVDRGRSRAMGGTGLGLSIVKHIVQLYNGTVQVKSEPGEGTEFCICFPVKTKHFS